MTSITEGWFTVPGDGVKLYTKTYLPAEGSLKARVVHVHGFSDHSDTYIALMTALVSQGIAVHAFDQRGWGKSVLKPAEKGSSGPTSTVLGDIDAFTCSVLALNNATPNIPVFMVGHSMGGAETLHFAAHGPASTRAQLRGYMVYGPFVALHPRTRPSSFTVTAGRLAGKLLPQFHMYQPLDETLLSLDPAVGKKFKADTLCHDTGTLEGLAGMLDRGIQMEEGKVVVQDEGEHKWGVWVSHGTDDQICDYAATAKWYERYCQVQDKTMRPWKGAYHRLHEDPEPTKSEFETEMIKWILDRS